MKHLTFLTLSSALLLSACTITTSRSAAATYSLNFGSAHYTTGTTTVNGQQVRYRAYENIVYVQHPEDAQTQRMNIYIPESYFTGGTVNGYTAQTAPIFLPNQVGGYLPAQPGTVAGGGLGGMGLAVGGQAPSLPSGTAPNMPGNAAPDMAAGGPPAGGPPGGEPGGLPVGGPPGMMAGGSPNAIQTALSRGYVVASPGARGRTSKNAAGEYIGKAPAAIVDLKAAVAYLRYNDAAMPGSAERIISNGTSAGGALSVLLGATGNNADYAPYLKALGAAPARDNVYAVSAYAPITNLDHADMAYEWLFNGVNTYSGRSGTGTLTAAQVSVSNELTMQFPAYVNSLNFTRDGQPLTLDAGGSGPFSRYVASLLRESAQNALMTGQDLSKLDWLTIRNGTVVGVDLAAYAKTVGRQKTPPAFDGLSLENPENEEFGTRTVNARHFTTYSQAHTAVSASSADAQTVRLMNPMDYIGTGGTTTAVHWRIRQGTADRDTSLAVPTLLAAKLADSGRSVDLAFPWNVPHSGDYDLPQLFDWMDGIVKQ